MSGTSVSRRGLLAATGAVGAGALIGAAFGSGTAAAGDSLSGGAVRSRKLVPGDRVRLVSPGSAPIHERVELGRRMLESWGLVVEIGAHALDSFGYLSASDADRLADLNAAFADPGVRAVLCTRGGYGTGRIIDGLDFAAVRADPKVVLGYSDITALHLALWKKARLATVHGPMIAWNEALDGPVDGPVAGLLKAALMSSEPVVVRRDAQIPTSTVTVPGRATGRFLGGNLSLLVQEPRAKNAPDTRGAIVLLEDVDEEPYRVDGMITQLLRDGWFTGVAGVALGTFVNSVGEPGEWTIIDVLRDRLAGLGVPVLGGLPIGHDVNPATVPLGTTATLDATAGTLTIQSAVR